MRIAGPASHQIFERNKRMGVTPHACLPQYDQYYNPNVAEEPSAMENVQRGTGDGVGLRALVFLVTCLESMSVFYNTNLRLAR